MSDERDPEREPEAGDNPVEAAEQAASQGDGGEAYADPAALEQDLADLIGGGHEEPEPAPAEAVELAEEEAPAEGPSPSEGGALGDPSAEP
ncbi:MAG: hypothetical protein ACQERG_05365, partial [Pseudomonadota bacterium]